MISERTARRQPQNVQNTKIEYTPVRMRYFGMVLLGIWMLSVTGSLIALTVIAANMVNKPLYSVFTDLDKSLKNYEDTADDFGAGFYHAIRLLGPRALNAIAEGVDYVGLQERDRMLDYIGIVFNALGDTHGEEMIDYTSRAVQGLVDDEGILKALKYVYTNVTSQA